MNWFLNISAQGKILLSLGLMILLILGVIGFSYVSIHEMKTSQEKLYSKDFTVALELSELKSNENLIRALVLQIQLSIDPVLQKELVQVIDETKKNMDSSYVKLQELLKEDTESLKVLSNISILRMQYGKTRDLQISLIFTGQQVEAIKIGLELQVDRFTNLQHLISTLAEKSIQEATLRVNKSNIQSEQATYLFLFLGGMGILLGGLMTGILTRTLASPLSGISKISQSMASGDLRTPILGVKRKDEIGVLINTFALMAVNLRGIAAEIIEGVDVLTNSSSEILASTTQVTASAAETAAAVSETTSAVEQVLQVSRIASDKSRSVSEISQKAARSAMEGKNALDKSLVGMSHIQKQVEAIAESVIRLSEQSEAIGEIISSVSNLAEQTNLLAVNAAIEAAKAGEQGKGFAVVAQEVKSLAEQSKNATTQVRAILNDIKKATDTAVMATEQGGKAVDAGTLQSHEAGEAIRVIGENIESTAQAALQIAASSQQQMVGMDQVALAMENIKDASEQNVLGMKQVEKTVQGLHELGQKLKHLASQYQV